MSTAMVFLVLMMSGTDQRTMVVMMPFETARECNYVLSKAPPENKEKFKCIRMEMSPASEEPTRKL